MLLRPLGLLLLVPLLSFAQGSTLKNPSDPPTVPPTDTPAPAVCPAGGPIGAVNLTVKSPAASSQPLPLEKINNLSEGDTVLYSPILRGKEVRHGEVSLVLVPVKHDPADPIIVTDPKPADKPQEWKIDRTMSIAAYVYGPAGLSKKKVKGFLSQDDLLIAQLADYAAKTAQTQQLIEALSDAQSSPAAVNAALSGFASQYGVTAPIDKTAPASVQAQMLFSTMNPQLATYDPLTPASGSRVGEAASLTTAAAGLFFGSPIGLAAGGTAMVLELRAIAFPGTQFRSSFAEEMKPGLNLCGQRTPVPAHTRVAYIWANRIPNAGVPGVTIGAAHYLPETQKTPLPVDVQEKAWTYLDRARDWTLENDKGQKTAIKVVKLANQKSLELDLTKAKLEAGDYHLDGFWDWTPFQTKGVVTIRPLSDFAAAKLEASSQDRLLAKSGKIAVTLENADFEFTTKVELKKANDEFAVAQPIPFVLPKGLREGPQDHMDVQVNTADLDSGQYRVLIAQEDGKPHPVSIKVLPSPPEIANFPILANQGAAMQHFQLKGQHLGLVARLEAPGAVLQLDPAAAEDTERNVTVRLTSDLKPGARVPVSEYLTDHSEPIVIPHAIEITGPLPVIASSKLSLPQGTPVTLNAGEFPAGGVLTAMLDVKNADARSSVEVSCDGDPGSAMAIRIGEQTDKWSLQQLSADQLFLSYDTSSLPAGCSVQVVLDNHAGGRSEPYVLARIVRLPVIDQFSATTEQTPDGKRVFVLTGRNLEMIDKIGWDQLTGSAVTELPTPVPGQGQKQSLRVVMPDPSAPTATPYVWLRGDKTGRGTTISLTPAPKA